MKAEGKWLFITVAVCLIVGGILGWVLHSTYTEKPKIIYSHKNKIDVKEQQIKLGVKDSGAVAVKRIGRTVKGDSSQTADLLDSAATEGRSDTTIYSDTLRATDQVATDSLEHKGKKYPIKYSIEVPHKVIITNSGATWVAKALVKLILPIIHEERMTDSTKVIEKPIFIPRPFFLDPYFYSTIALFVATILGILF